MRDQTVIQSLGEGPHVDLMLEKRLRGFVGCESHTLDVWELLILIDQKGITSLARASAK